MSSLTKRAIQWRSLLGASMGLLWITVIGLNGFQPAAATPPGKTELAIEKTDDAVVVRSGGKEGQEIVRFQMRQPEKTGMLIESAAYFHPLRTPAGTVVTALAPTAHKYYRGVFMAYVVMRGEKDADFWGWGGVVPRKDRKIINKDVTGLTGGVGGKPASFRAKNEWLAEGVTMVKEDLQVEIRTKDAANVLDLVYTLTAEADTRLAQFTVGGLALPVRTDCKIEAQGPDGPVNLPSSTLKLGTDWPAAAWYGYTLTLPDGTKVGTAVIDHPKNPETLWHLSLDAKVINPCITALREVVMKANVPLTLRYRVIAQDGPLSRDLVNELAREWAGPKP